VVPGLPQWEYAFHGRGCSLSHTVTGEQIDVDFHDATAEWIDPWFFLHRLKSFVDVPAPERALLSLHPDGQSVLFDVTVLEAVGLAVRHEDGHGFRLHRGVADHEALVDAFCLAQQQAGPAVELLPVRAELVAARTKLIVRSLEGAMTAEGLHALAAAGAEETDDYVAHALTGPPGPVTVAAMEIIHARGHPEALQRVREVVRRLTPDGPPPLPHLWFMCAEWFIKHGPDSHEAHHLLERTAGDETGLAALRALEVAPQSALGLIRRALRLSVPLARVDAAGVLVNLGADWCRAELRAALEEVDSQECRAALRLLDEPCVPPMDEETARSRLWTLQGTRERVLALKLHTPLADA
jgi:hypothetical protein